MIKILRTLVAATAVLAPITAQAPCQGCTKVTYGQSCGPVLDATLTANGGNSARLTVLVANADPSGVGFMMWGKQQLDLQLPGTLCHYYTDYVYGHFFQIGGDGTASLGHAWPGSQPGFFFIQVADIERQGTFFSNPRLSNGVRVERL